MATFWQRLGGSAKQKGHGLVAVKIFGVIGPSYGSDSDPDRKQQGDRETNGQPHSDRQPNQAPGTCVHRAPNVGGSLPRRFFVDQFVEVVADAAPEVFDVEPSIYAGRRTMPPDVQAEVGR